MIRLSLLSGPGGTWECDLVRVRLGRAPDAEVCLEHHAGLVVSERHALVEFRDDDGYWLIDDGSRNGTFLDGERVDAPRPLRDGDVIRLGADAGPELRVHFVIDRERVAALASSGRHEDRVAGAAVALAVIGVLAGGVWLLLVG